MAQTQDAKLLSVKDIMQYTGFGEKRVRELLKNNKNKFTVSNGNRLYAHKDLFDKYLIELAKTKAKSVVTHDAKQPKMCRYDNQGRVLPKGISQRKDGRYEYRKTYDGNKIAYYSMDYDEIIAIKTEYEKVISQTDCDKTLAYMYEEMMEIKNIKEGKYIYFISNGTYCKIGYASDINKRLADLQCANTEKLNLLYSFKTIDYKNIEKWLHIIFQKYHISGEWYDILFLFNGGENNE